jgi:hypothetical protein
MISVRLARRQQNRLPTAVWSPERRAALSVGARIVRLKAECVCGALTVIERKNWAII